MADNNTIQIKINVVDANSNQVISSSVKNLESLGAAGKKSGTDVAVGMKAAADAQAAVATASTASAKTTGDAWQGVTAKLDGVTAAATRAQQASAAAGSSSAKRVSSEMQQMLDNVERAQKKMATTNFQHGPSTQLGEAFASVGTAADEVERLGLNFQRTQSSAEGAGNAGANAGKRIGGGMHEAGGHTLSALDRVRLLRDDLGIRIPRAMESVIASSKGAMAAIGAIGTGLVVLGAVEVLGRLAMQAYELVKRLADVNAETRKFTEDFAKASQQDLFNNASIETTRSLLQQVRAEKDAIDKQRTDAGVGLDNSGSFMQYARMALTGVGNNPGTMGAGLGGTAPGTAGNAPRPLYTQSTDQVNAQLSADEELLRRRTALQQSEQKLQDAQNRVAIAGGAMQGRAAESAKLRAQNELAQAQKFSTQAQEQYNHAATQRARLLEDAQGKLPKEERTRVYQVDPNAGESERQRAVAQNMAEARNQGAGMARTDQEATAKANAEAREAGLRGEALYLDKYQEQQRVLAQAHAQTLIGDRAFYAQRADLEQQYQADRRKRLENENAETKRMQDEASAGGQTGFTRTDAESRARMDAIAKQAPDFSNPDTRGQRETAERQRDQQEQEKEADQFNDRLRTLVDDRANSSMSADQRILAETQRTRNEILKAWQDLYGGLAANDQRRLQAAIALQGELGKVDQQGQREIAQNRQQLLDQTVKTEAEGARSGMTRENEQRQAIVDAYAERFQQLEELRQKDADNADLYRRQEIAAQAEMQGKLLEQERAARDKLAGELRGFMTNPLEALKRLGEDTASKYAADFLLKAQGKGTGNAGASGGRHSSLSDMVGIPEFHRGGAGHGGTGTPSDPAKAPPVVTASSNVSAASTRLTASSAEIHVGTATFTGMSGGAGAAVPAAQAMAASGARSAVMTGNAGVSTTAGAYSQLAGSAGLSSTATTGGYALGAGDSTGGVPSASLPGNAGVSTTGGAYAQLAASQSAGGGAPSAMNLAAVDVSGGISQAKGAADLGKDLFGKTGAAGTLGKASSVLGTAGQIAGPAAGIFGAIESNGGFGGAFGGATSGAQLGGMLGGPLGAGIGAAAGAILGFLGIGGASKAEHYYNEKVKPRIQNDLTQFGMGAMDYQSAYQDLVSLDKEARDTTKKYGMGGKREWDGHIHPDIMAAQKQLDREQKAGRSQFGMSAAQFHSGGYIGGFGDFATSPNEGFIHAKVGETVMHESATATHGDALAMMLAGASRGDMASHYGGGNSGGGDTNLHFHSPDSAGAYQLFMDNKHHIRRALNESYAENSGGSDLG